MVHKTHDKYAEIEDKEMRKRLQQSVTKKKTS